MAVQVVGHSSRLSGLAEGGWGPGLELALGHGRWQLLAEGSVAWVTAGPVDQEVHGRQLRGGGAVRWIARSFELMDFAAVEMALEAFAGVERFDWQGGGALVRPDLGVGVGWQIRTLKHHQLGFRSEARVFFAPTDRDAATAVCRGTCTMPASTSSAGLMAIFGAQW
jgi:hypothetical protein